MRGLSASETLHPARAPRRPDDDAPLIEAAQAGDLAAFEAIVVRHRATVLRVAARIVGEDGAEDVAQESFLRAFHRLGSFQGTGAFRSWLLRITHNTALDALDRRPAAIGLDAIQELPDPPAAARTPVERLESQERIRRLDVKLRGLPPAHRAVLVLRDVEGLSYEEIADVTQTPLGSVKARLHRARSQLIEALRANAYDWQLPG